MNRSAQKLKIFTGDSDFREFVRLLRTFCQRNDLKVHAYCVLPTHYHVLARGSGEQLTQCFHEVDRLWALTINERRNAKGHVFQGPFLSFPQRTAGWVVRTSLYIHLNPVGWLCKEPGDFEWSTCRDYLGTRKGDSWIDLDPVLSFFDNDATRARSAYRELLRLRLELQGGLRGDTEEERVMSSQAAELAISVPTVAARLSIPDPEARKLVACYGRDVLRISLATLASALKYRDSEALSAQLTRVRGRLQREPGLQGLWERAVEVLETSPD